MVSGTLALLKWSVIYMNVNQGSGPDRGRSPVEWGDEQTDRWMEGQMDGWTDR